MPHVQRTLALFLLGFMFTAIDPRSAAAAEKPEPMGGVLWVYVGTYTKTPQSGINFFQLNLASGHLTKPEVVAKTPNPTFLALHARQPLLYAISEVSEFEGTKSGFVSAYRIQPRTGRLDLLNQQSSGGSGPCHVSVDRSGRLVLVANYGGGSVASLPIRPDGSLNPAATVEQHHGSSVHPARQTGPFAHCIDADPTNRFALSADLGIDKLLIYRLNSSVGTLTPHQPAFVETARGAGPRHLAFHPNGRFVYVINELNCTISVFGYDSTRGILEPVENVSTLPGDFGGENTGAEIQIHPSGRFIYGSNRGHNSIAIFAVDSETGKLHNLGYQSTLGKTPRHFALDPSGRYLLAANQDSGNVVVFRVDPRTGLLQPTGVSVSIPMPVCVVMSPPLE
ncbi:MAG: lactonase family protein [Thermoguttaceae bacterium]